MARETPAKIVATDPFITAESMEPVPGVEFEPDFETALVGADVVFIATNHSVYAATATRFSRRCGVKAERTGWTSGTRAVRTRYFPIKNRWRRRRC